MAQRDPTATDDFGKPLAWRSMAQNAHDDPEAFRAMQAAHMAAGVYKTRPLMVLCEAAALLAVLGGIVLFARVAYGSPGNPVRTVVLGFALWGAAWVTVWWAGRSIAADVERERVAFRKRFCIGLLEAGFCPGCCYRLAWRSATGPEAVVCPECGAAWKAREEGERA